MTARTVGKTIQRTIAKSLGDDGASGVTVIQPTKGLAIGDSTVATYTSNPGLHLLTLSRAEVVAGFTLDTIAVSGNTIAQQKTAWAAYSGKTDLDYVWVQVGLNDMDPAISSATTLAAYQDLIDTIRAGVSASCKIIGATMTPAYERWPNVPWTQADAQAKWVALNDAIMGRGASPITGLDYREEDHTLALSKDVSGNAALTDAYDSGDRIHPNNYGRSIVGQVFRALLQTEGFVYANSSIVSPIYVPTLLQWMDGQDATTLLESTGPDVLADSGDGIGQWTDKSGNSMHFTQSSTKPTLATLGSTDKLAVRFNGTDQFLQSTLPAGVTYNVGMAFVVMYTTDTQHSLWHNFTGVNSYFYLAKAQANAGLKANSRVWFNGVETAIVNKDALADAINGAPVVFAVSCPTLFANFALTAGYFRIGLYNFETYQFTGDVAETAIYRSIPTDAAIDAINSSLMEKYGITA